jgi:hypothetical protein
MTQEDLLPEHQQPLVEALERALRRGNAGIIFDVDAKVRSVDVKVPTFWLSITSRMPISAMAIVTTATLVRVAGRGFGVANRLRGLPTQVEVFPTLSEALTWVGRQMGPEAQAS